MQRKGDRAQRLVDLLAEVTGDIQSLDAKQLEREFLDLGVRDADAHRLALKMTEAGAAIRSAEDRLSEALAESRSTFYGSIGILMEAARRTQV